MNDRLKNRPAMLDVIALLLALTACYVSHLDSLFAALPAIASTDDPQRAADAAMADQLDAAVAAAQGTPGQEAANRINISGFHDLELQLRRQLPADAKQLAAARTLLGEILITARQGPTWPRPPLVRIPRATGPVSIDGKLDDAAWKSAAVFHKTYPYNKKEAVEHPQTTWYVMWDDRYLYFAFDCEDPHIVAPVLKRDDQIYLYDCVEMYICPELRTGVYWEIEISPSGSIYDAINNKHFQMWGMDARTEENVHGMKVGIQLHHKPDGSDEGYTVEVAVPFDQLPEYSRAKPAVGQRLNLMLVRLDKNGDEFAPYTFVPILSWAHNIWNHAPAELVESLSAGKP